MDHVARTFPALARIDLAREADFPIGAMWVRPSRCRVEAAGETRAVQRRVMQVLVALAHPEGEVVSQDELIRRCWGGLTVTEDAIGRCISQLRRLADGWPQRPFDVETIAGVGYRLTARPASTAASPVDERPRLRPGPRVWAVAALVLVAAVGTVWMGARAHSGRAQPPTVAVAPFRLLAGDRAAAGFAASVSDNLIGALNENRIQTLAAGAGTSPDLVLAGTVYAAGGVTRVRVELDDVRSKLALWTAQFEEPSANAGRLRDRVAGAAGEAIYAAGEPAAQDGLAVPPSALALFIKAEQEVKSPEVLKEDEAIRAAQQAVALAPDFAAARGLLSLALVEWAPYVEDAPAAAELSHRAEAEARRAIAASPAHADAAYEALNFLGDRRGPTDLLAHEDRILAALRKEPDFPFLNMRECRFLVNVGRAEAALPYCQRAMALRPLADPIGWSYGAALYSAGQPDLARRQLARAIAYHPDHYSTRGWSFDIEAFGGSPDSAHAILHDPERVPPTFSPEAVAALDAMLDARRAPAPSRTDAAMAALWEANRSHRLPKRYVALSAAVLGRPDEAFAALQDRLFLFPEPFDMFEPEEASLWRDPRFWRLAARRGLVNYWRARRTWPDLCASSGGALDCPKLVASAGV